MKCENVPFTREIVKVRFLLKPQVPNGEKGEKIKMKLTFVEKVLLIKGKRITLSDREKEYRFCPSGGMVDTSISKIEP
jgi:hypothetical protein